MKETRESLRETDRMAETADRHLGKAPSAGRSVVIDGRGDESRDSRDARSARNAVGANRGPRPYPVHRSVLRAAAARDGGFIGGAINTIAVVGPSQRARVAAPGELVSFDEQRSALRPLPLRPFSPRRQDVADTRGDRRITWLRTVRNAQVQSALDLRENVIWCGVRKPARTPSAPHADASRKWTTSAAHRKQTSLARQRGRFAVATAIREMNGPGPLAERDARRWPASPRHFENDRHHSIEDDYWMVVIDTKGSPNDLAFEPLRHLRAQGRAASGCGLPFDFGFVPSTRAEDGDPLDVLVLMDAPVLRLRCPVARSFVSSKRSKPKRGEYRASVPRSNSCGQLEVVCQRRRLTAATLPRHSEARSESRGSCSTDERVSYSAVSPPEPR